MDSAETLLNGLFFDARRYDLSAVGRYKFNKKMAPVAPPVWAEAGPCPVADPRTGEIIAEAGENLTGSGPGSWRTEGSMRLSWMWTASW